MALQSGSARVADALQVNVPASSGFDHTLSYKFSGPDWPDLGLIEFNFPKHCYCPLVFGLQPLNTLRCYISALH